VQEKARERFRALMTAELARIGRGDRAARQEAASRMAAAVDALIQRNGMDAEQAAGLREALATVVAESESEPSPTAAHAFPPLDLAAARPQPSPRRPNMVLRAAIGGLVLAIAAGGAIVLHPGIAAALQTTTDPPHPTNPEIARFQDRLKGSGKAVTSATRYLEEVRKRVEERLKADPLALAALASEKFAPLKAVDPELHKKMPKAIRNAKVTVRATPVGYKILLRTSLCTDIKYSKPAFVDPKRDFSTAGCQYAAVWNEGGREF
jgi:hypothetical protein